MISTQRIPYIASGGRDDAIEARDDDDRACHGRAHDVSHRNGDVLEPRHSQPRGRCATIRIKPPHAEQAGGSTPPLLSGAFAGDPSFLFTSGSASLLKSERQRVSF